MAKSDLYGRPGKNQHAFCLSVGREYPYDVRVLANVRPDTYWMDTMLHEFGHAVYERHVNPSLPYLLRSYAHVATTEAIALMMGSLAEEPGWLTRFAGVPAEDLRPDLVDAPAAGPISSSSRAGRSWCSASSGSFTQIPTARMNSLWWDLVERLQLVGRPPGRDEPDWAAKTTSPRPPSTTTTTPSATSSPPSSETTWRPT